MMCEGAKRLPSRSWLNVLINDSQGSGGCGRDGDLVKMNDSCDPIDLMPADPFEMNAGSISAASAGWIEYNPDDYEACAGDPFLEIMEKMKINGSPVSGGCGREEDWVKMNSSFDPIDLLPTDPFEMNVVSEIDISKRISGIIERWIGCSTGDCKPCAGDPTLDSGYYQGKPFLSSFETRVNSATDFNKVDFSGSVLDVTREGKFGAFGAVEEASFSGRDFSESVSNVTVDESILAFEDMEEVLVLGRCFSGSDLDVAGDGSFGACENVEGILYPGGRDANHPDGDANCLHGGLLLSLGYLGVRDLLSAERVCRSFRSAVKNDPLLWRCIHIDSSLGEKITDDDLYCLTQRAEGNLRCLILVQCPNITFDGLKRVLDSNPMLKMLNVPGFVRLTPDGHIKNLKTSELSGMPPKLGRHFIGSVEDFEELRLLVGADEPLLTKARKLHFFHDEICQSKPDHCRACCACIERCADCGRCLDNCNYIETFFLNNICSVCADRSAESLAEKGVDANYKF